MAYTNEVVIIPDSPSPPPPPPPLLAEPNYFENFDFDDNLLEFALEELPPMSHLLQSSSEPGLQQDKLTECEEAVLSCFPDICPEYLKSQVARHAWDAQAFITELLDNSEKGQPYPKRSNLLKRKRQEVNIKDEEEELRKKFEDADPRLARKGPAYVSLYLKTAKALLKSSFPELYADDIENTFKANNCQLYTTYLALDKSSWSQDAQPMRVKKAVSKRFHSEEALRAGAREAAEMDALEAFDAARAVCTARAQVRSSKEAEEKRKAQEEEANFQRAKAEGTTADCGCCFDEQAMNRMVHCDGGTPHWFCRSCARQMAEHAIGLSKHRLDCMSVDGCAATFSKDQKELFLDERLATALELIEQEEVLRLAGIDGLEHCPFCRYAAEYPPVEENKEFRCENPECSLVSCRLCRQETHLPKTCQEAAQERGISARRTIEEAMSAAMIRKCNKCGTPFIKENGCNKMTCTRSGCKNVQCYVCSKSCDYTHFDDRSRGGKKGNCPLFDDVEQRHEDEVKAAEELARKQVVSENPNVDEDLLKVNFSEEVRRDEERRRARRPGPRPVAHHHPIQAAHFAQGVPFFQVLVPQANPAIPAEQLQNQLPQQEPAAQPVQAGAFPYYVPIFAAVPAQLGPLNSPAAPVAPAGPVNIADDLNFDPTRNAHRERFEVPGVGIDAYRKAKTATVHAKGAGDAGGNTANPEVTRALLIALEASKIAVQGHAGQAGQVARVVQPIPQPNQDGQGTAARNIAVTQDQQLPQPLGGVNTFPQLQGRFPPLPGGQGGT
ncbi:hypothetical protein C7999DRAFT_40445 [Corynascus novoguineensis]|uniref:RING-type domain-containing protein n=1 Tax=Corynascus novoguineensis TaxID=1126955 RepID=A0AAN7CUJ8_9PEZI|nr:hypothetical protein C7999DRAFT_40445 [Corynascus novoguineensis]